MTHVSGVRKAVPIVSVGLTETFAYLRAHHRAPAMRLVRAFE